MAARGFGIALLFAVLGSPAWCACPRDAVPLGVIQSQDELGARPLDVVVRELHLVNVNHATLEEQQQIASSLVGLCFRADENNEVAERIRDGFQRHGFFQARVVQVQTKDRDSSADPPTVSITARVEEGARYRLSQITFINNRALPERTLRKLIPMKDGDLFDVEMVRKGISKLRDAYGALGYLNFTPVPNTNIDAENKLITLAFDMDEGVPFFVASLTVSGGEPQQQAALLGAWPESLKPGKIYNKRLVELFFQKAKDLFPPGASSQNIIISQNPHQHTVDIILSLEPN